MTEPRDYTLERAREVYSRDEFTCWMLGWGLSDAELPPFVVDIVAIRGEYTIFTYGYIDEKIHRLGWSPTASGSAWWGPMLNTVRHFYAERRFYGPS